MNYVNGKCDCGVSKKSLINVFDSDLTFYHYLGTLNNKQLLGNKQRG